MCEEEACKRWEGMYGRHRQAGGMCRKIKAAEGRCERGDAQEVYVYVASSPCLLLSSLVFLCLEEKWEEAERAVEEGQVRREAEEVVGRQGRCKRKMLPSPSPVLSILQSLFLLPRPHVSKSSMAYRGEVAGGSPACPSALLACLPAAAFFHV